MTSNLTYFFDITTSAQWSGHPVGIVRVERELAARARDHLGDRTRYCVYDKTSGSFKSVKEELVPGLLSGTFCIDFEQPLDGLISPGTRGLKRQLRNMALEIPVAYQLIQRMRGHTFSRHDIKLMRKKSKQDVKQPSRSTHKIQLHLATDSQVILNENVIIITGGLDWEHKHLRNIFHLRQKTKFRLINIIYDLIPINLPHYVVPHYVDLLTEYFGELLWATDGCICISETTRKDLLVHFEKNGVVPPPIRSFPLGSDLRELIKEETMLPPGLIGKKYILFVSTLEPRKNHRTAYDAWCHALLNETIDAANSRLVFVGRQGWLTGDLVHEMANNPLTRDTVVMLANVSDNELALLYQGAAFTIFPSFYEGFGLPLAEALGYCKACLTSGAGALAEIGSEFRIDIDPRDTIGWATHFAEFLNNPEKLLQIETNIRQHYKPVNWNQSALLFFNCFKEISV